MKSTAVFFVFVLCAFLILPGQVFAWGEVGKAEDFIKAGMYPQAIDVLEKRIMEKPTDAEAQFLLGNCYVHTGSLSQANDRFSSAVKLNTKYGYKIGTIYLNAGIEALGKVSVGQARSLFGQAVQFQPALKSKISGVCYEQGMIEFEGGRYSAANDLFRLATSFGAVDAAKISNMYFEVGNTRPVDSSFALYQIASSWGSTHNEAIKNRLLEASKTCKNQELRGTRYARLRDEAAKFGTVEPDFVVYGPGEERTWDLKAGETISKYIRFADHTNCLFYSDKDNAWGLVSRDGKQIKRMLGKNLPKNLTDFKIYAKEDVYVVIQVKPLSP